MNRYPICGMSFFIHICEHSTPARSVDSHLFSSLSLVDATRSRYSISAQVYARLTRYHRSSCIRSVNNEVRRKSTQARSRSALRLDRNTGRCFFSPRSPLFSQEEKKGQIARRISSRWQGGTFANTTDAEIITASLRRKLYF